MRASKSPMARYWRCSGPTAPAGLAAHLDHRSGVLEIRTDDISGALRGLIDWADRRRLDLTGIEVGPPSLEDAYLATIGQLTAHQEPIDE